MKKYLLIAALIMPLIFAGCEEDEPEAVNVKIEASGSDYSITVKDNDNITLLSKEAQHGANTYNISLTKDIGVYHTTQSTLSLKIYRNDVIVHDRVLNRGNGVSMVYIE